MTVIMGVICEKGKGIVMASDSYIVQGDIKPLHYKDKIDLFFNKYLVAEVGTLSYNIEVKKRIEFMEKADDFVKRLHRLMIKVKIEKVHEQVLQDKIFLESIDKDKAKEEVEKKLKKNFESFGTPELLFGCMEEGNARLCVISSTSIIDSAFLETRGSGWKGSDSYFSDRRLDYSITREQAITEFITAKLICEERFEGVGGPAHVWYNDGDNIKKLDSKVVSELEDILQEKRSALRAHWTSELGDAARDLRI